MKNILFIRNKTTTPPWFFKTFYKNYYPEGLIYF